MVPLGRNAAAGFPNTCDLCHKFTDLTWDDGVYDHATFPLMAANAIKDGSGYTNPKKLSQADIEAIFEAAY